MDEKWQLCYIWFRGAQAGWVEVFQPGNWYQYPCLEFLHLVDDRTDRKEQRAYEKELGVNAKNAHRHLTSRLLGMSWQPFGVDGPNAAVLLFRKRYYVEDGEAGFTI